MFKLTKEIILEYLSSIKEELNQDGIVEIGLFGSYAKDKADLASDIDIVICSSESFLKKFRGFEGAIYLDDLRQRIMKHFKIQVDICDTFSMNEERKKNLLESAIYV
ncbi:putative nucleotidyltransferase [Helicobacter fennelliae]|uniref:Putative nucleotidyltransferase n=1 Tax=Helicobacter fennelliae TaxID=215 RepID=A0A2X3GHJ1_9HELI|nr:nucleotidyltransferase domain-containing protein [Helicobacter fennelliae]SQC36409.1 putative nucleotidyltransferase [Helicobacter fennelliae]